MKRRILSVIGLSFLLSVSIPAFAETAQYQYDEINRLEKVIHEDGTTITYTYDAAGNREIKEVNTPPETPVINFIWPRKVKAFNIDVTPAQVGTKFSPGTNLKFKVKLTVEGDPAKLYKVKLTNGKIVLPYLPTGDPDRVTKLTNPNGKKVDVVRNVIPGDTKIVRLVGQLPTSAEVGQKFKFTGKVKLYEMNDPTLINVYIVRRTFSIVE